MQSLRTRAGLLRCIDRFSPGNRDLRLSQIRIVRNPEWKFVCNCEVVCPNSRLRASFKEREADVGRAASITKEDGTARTYEGTRDPLSSLDLVICHIEDSLAKGGTRWVFCFRR